MGVLHTPALKNQTKLHRGSRGSRHSEAQAGMPCVRLTWLADSSASKDSSQPRRVLQHQEPGWHPHDSGGCGVTKPKGTDYTAHPSAAGSHVRKALVICGVG